jgi:hypothetical protein
MRDDRPPRQANLGDVLAVQPLPIGFLSAEAARAKARQLVLSSTPHASPLLYLDTTEVEVSIKYPATIPQ